jgi:hypothetical protein
MIWAAHEPWVVERCWSVCSWWLVNDGRCSSFIPHEFQDVPAMKTLAASKPTIATQSVTSETPNHSNWPASFSWTSPARWSANRTQSQGKCTFSE